MLYANDGVVREGIGTEANAQVDAALRIEMSLHPASAARCRLSRRRLALVGLGLAVAGAVVTITVNDVATHKSVSSARAELQSTRDGLSAVVHERDDLKAANAAQKSRLNSLTDTVYSQRHQLDSAEASARVQDECLTAWKSFFDAAVKNDRSTGERALTRAEDVCPSPYRPSTGFVFTPTA